MRGGGCGEGGEEGVSLEEGGKDGGFDSNEEEVVPKVDDVSLVNGVFNGAFVGDGEEDLEVRGRGLCGCHRSRREVKKMIVKMVEVMTIGFGDKRRMVDRRRMKKKWRDDLFSCRDPFESFDLVEWQEDT
ncbi:hypothetical protein Tco_0488176 [Tanacetum coccineum]